MEDLLKKVSQYQLLNFLMSGAVLVLALSKTTSINLTPNDAVLSFFIYYFVGLVISRLGSLVVEPILKLLRIIKFRSYADYIHALKADPKLDTLSQENNTYRTLIATFLVFLCLYMIDNYGHSFLLGKSLAVITAITALLVLLFTFAYRKQTKYITKRIDQTLSHTTTSSKG